ncbi:MAG: HAD-IIB family hydrolase [Nitrospira sp.]
MQSKGVRRARSGRTIQIPDHRRCIKSLTGMPRYLLFTDLDGSLLDNDTYSFDEAKPALHTLQSQDIPVILVSGKTRAEIEPLRERLDHQAPFIVENGAAVYVPIETFDFTPERSRRRSSYHVIELGTPYALLRDVLRQIETAVGTRLRGFGDLSVDEVMATTGLSREDALRAMLREFDEPFLVNGPPRLIEEICRQIVARDLSWTKGGRFFHLTGKNDKGRAADILLRCYRRQGRDHEEDNLETIGIGDSLNDLPLLLMVDHPILVQKPDGTYDPDINLPNLIRARGIGPTGWNRAVIELLQQVTEQMPDGRPLRI